MSLTQSEVSQTTGRDKQQTARAGLIGMYLAGVWVALSVLPLLPIMAVAGEGDYIMIVWGVLEAALLIGAVRVRQQSVKGSVRRACATWVIVESAALCSLMLLLTVLTTADGSWR